MGLNIKDEKLFFAKKFIRDDKQQILMLIYYAKTNSNKVVLSDEHTDYVFLDFINFKNRIAKEFNSSVKEFEKHFLK